MESIQNVLQSGDVEPLLRELVESKLVLNSNLSSDKYRGKANDFFKMRVDLCQTADIIFAAGKSDLARVLREYAEQCKCLIRECHQNAVKEIMAKHAKRLKNDSILDLHFLFVPEAIVQMDDFLDNHISQSRFKVGKASKFFVKIITGRGRHSANGIPKIKPAVINRLEQRGLKFNYLNPGLLQVGVNPYCKLANDLRNLDHSP